MKQYLNNPIISSFRIGLHYLCFGIVVSFLLAACAGKYDIQPKPDSKIPSPAILSINPICGRIGDTITILGHNFSPIANKNELTINGTRLSIIASDTAYIKAVVPPQLGSGNMIIIVSGKTGQGPDFKNISSGLISTYVQDISTLGIMADKNGDIYMADAMNNRVRRYTKSGSRNYLAGNGAAAFIDGNGANAYFNYPMDVAVDSKGNVFVTDNGNSCIRKINTNGDVVLYAGKIAFINKGSFPVPGYQDGVRTESLFKHPTGITIDKNDNLYVCDAGNNRIRKITPDGINYVGEVSTIAGNGTYGSQDGNAPDATFSYMEDLVVDSAGNIFLIEQDVDKVRKISTNHIVTTVLQGPNTVYTDCKNLNTYFQFPSGIAIDKKGILYVSIYIDEENYKIISISPDNTLNTLVGGNLNGLLQGFGTNARVRDAGSLTFIDNDLYVVSDFSIMKVVIQ